MSKKLAKAFQDLRLKGYFAEQEFRCCSTCGWSEVPSEKAEKAVFYHEQDADDLKARGSCFLTWSGDATEIRACFEANGIRTEHDGDTARRIEIHVRKP